MSFNDLSDVYDEYKTKFVKINYHSICDYSELSINFQKNLSNFFFNSENDPENYKDCKTLSIGILEKGMRTAVVALIESLIILQF